MAASLANAGRTPSAAVKTIALADLMPSNSLGHFSADTLGVKTLEDALADVNRNPNRQSKCNASPWYTSQGHLQP